MFMTIVCCFMFPCIKCSNFVIVISRKWKGTALVLQGKITVRLQTHVEKKRLLATKIVLRREFMIGRKWRSLVFSVDEVCQFYLTWFVKFC